MNDTQDKTESGFRFESPDVLGFFLKNLKPLALVTLLGAVVSIIVALSITPRYQSWVIMFPASSSSVSNDLLSLNQGRKDILKFGSEEEVEQMLQVLQSDLIRERVVKKFQLFAHYDIDTLSPYKQTYLNLKYAANVTSRRTEFMSVRVDVLDADPQVAADMANYISDLVDTAMAKMQKDRAHLALKLVEKEYFGLIREMHQLEDSLSVIRLKGINNYETQSEVFNTGLANAIIRGNAAAKREIQSKIDTLSKWGGAYVSLRDKLIYETERLSRLKAKYLEAKVDAEQQLPYKFIVDRAVKSEKKAKPVRWLIVSLSTLGTFIFAFIGLIFIDLLSGRVGEIKAAFKAR